MFVFDSEVICMNEGIDPTHPCAYDSRSETLEDDEGCDIHWRVIGVDNDSDEDGEDGD